jgi:hypothetical protein
VRLLVAKMDERRRARSGPHISYVVQSGSLRIASAEYGLSARLASAYEHYQPGSEAPIPEDDRPYRIHDPEHALIRRQDGWYACLSGVVTPPVDSRWGQDRQNYVSIWHERTGLIVGGGNSKNQPQWSTFSVGQDEDLAYLPGAAALHPGQDSDGVSLTYAGHTCRVEIRVASEDRLAVSLAGTARAAVTAHLVFKLRLGEELQSSTGEQTTVGEERIEVEAGASGAWVAHHGWRVTLPAGSQLLWPVLPFNPYAADDAAPIDEAAAILSVPLGEEPVSVVLEVPGV